MTGRIIEAIRQHWHIENKLHWRLDVIFREDESRVRRGYAGENLSMLKKMVLNLMTQNRAFNAGIQTQRFYAAWNENTAHFVLHCAIKLSTTNIYEKNKL